MIGIQHNLNKDEILKINNDILNLALETDYNDPEARQKASDKFRELVKRRAELYKKGEISISQKKLRDMIKETLPEYQIVDEHEIGKLRLDIYLPDLNMAFEFDGPQHHIYPNHIHKTKKEFEKQQRCDRQKDKMCKQQGITLIRIRWDEELSMKTILSKVMTVNKE
ncbi:MAG: PDDEXK family nuclease, partial [Thermincolia bacterium]